jgi:hypothetical protein
MVDTIALTLPRAMTDPKLFGGVFGSASWASWRALLSGFYGLPLTPDQAEVYREITGRAEAPTAPHSELWLAVGRRGGKSHIAALMAVWEAAFKDHRERLAPGEWATVMCIASDRAQARILLRYIKGFFEHPMLEPLVKRETETSLELRHRTAIEVATASHRGVRGYTLAAAVADEVAFWHVDGVSPDAEIINALRPALATLGGPLIALSSPYAKRGVLWTAISRHHGRNHPRILTAQAPSRTMNPSLPQSIVDDAMAEDPAAARAEWLAEFRSDIASFLDATIVANCTRPRPAGSLGVRSAQVFRLH